MDDKTAFDRQLATGLDRMAGPGRHIDAAAMVQTATSQSPRWKFQSMFSATKFVIAGAIVALFGGLLLAGVLTQPSDDQPPVVGASVPATTQAEPTDTAIADPKPSTEAVADVATLDILPGVDLVTEKVEPGVYRVLSDGVREPTGVIVGGPRQGKVRIGDIVAGLDGSVWWFWNDRFYRLGDEALHAWPKVRKDFWPGRTDIDLEVGRDGTIWLTALIQNDGSFGGDLWSYDGQTWATRWKGETGKRWAHGVEVQEDGAVWLVWTTNRGHRVARIGDDDWEIVATALETDHTGIAIDGELTLSDGGGSEVWFRPGEHRALFRHDGADWATQAMPADAGAGGVMRADVGPDGTVWVRLHPECGPSECDEPSDVLARFDGEDWEVYDSSDGVPMIGGHVGTPHAVFEVAPDRSIWFTPIETPGGGPDCHGIANFDGEAVTSFMRDACITAMDIAPDGTVWLQAVDFEDGRWHTYVIPRGAEAATE